VVTVVVRGDLVVRGPYVAPAVRKLGRRVGVVVHAGSYADGVDQLLR
jgi:hypothetical protein